MTADNLEVKLTLKAVDGGWQAVVNQSKGGLNKLNNQVKQYGNTAQETAKKGGLLKNHFQSIVLAAGGFAAFSQAARTIANFGQSLSNLSAITGATGEDLEFYRQTALELGKQSTQSANDIVTAFKLVGSAKPELLENREALANVTKEVIVLAEASELDLTQATRVAVTALNQYGAGADQASRFVNALVSLDIAQSKGGVIILLKTRKTIWLSLNVFDL